MNCKDIIAKWLADNEYDGLYNADSECGCNLKDFMPCDGDDGIIDCQPGYLQPWMGDYWVGPHKEEQSDPDSRCSEGGEL